MVYLLKMVIFYGYVSHNQMVFTMIVRSMFRFSSLRLLSYALVRASRGSVTAQNHLPGRVETLGVTAYSPA